MKQYQDLIRDLLENGTQSTDRTGVGTLRKAGHTMRFDLQKGIPLVTTKKIHMKSVIHELIWFLSGDTNIKYLVDNGVSIWNEWADENGNLGPIYSSQWRKWRGVLGIEGTNGANAVVVYVDQIQDALDLLRTKPDDRGNIVNAWNVADLPLMALRPCHCMFQLLVIDGKLNLVLTQRSCDAFLGVPFNLASYALLTHMFAQQANLEVGELIWNGGDVHLYKTHLQQAEVLLSRPCRPLPKLELRKAASMFDYKLEDFNIVGYNPWPVIKAPVAV